MGDSEQNRAGNGGQQDPGTGRFLPGNRANPGGRPKSLARIIDEESEGGDSREIVKRMFAFSRGQVLEDAAEQTDSSEKGKTVKVARRTVPTAVQERATEWLGEQRWGKPTQSVTVEEKGASLDELSDSDFRAIFAEQVAADPELRALVLKKAAEAVDPKPPEAA